MGRVYLGTKRSGRLLAIKVIRPEYADDEHFRDRFRREAEAAERVRGIYTAPVVDADPDGSHPGWRPPTCRGRRWPPPSPRTGRCPPDRCECRPSASPRRWPPCTPPASCTAT
ncbi:hypothetical protein GCM10022221_77690 [Actinocorallia aurea]